MLTRYHRRQPRAAPPVGGWAATAAELPELDGARVAVLGLHHGEDGTILHVQASGVTPEDDWRITGEPSPCRPCGYATAAAAGTPHA